MLLPRSFPEPSCAANRKATLPQIERLSPASPELLLAIKVAVDADPRPGRFLLTGSARLLSMRDLPDTLAGRIETIELWPFSQGEIDHMPDGFIDAAFGLGPDLHLESTISRAEHAERVVRGGLPEAVARTAPRRRERFLDEYVPNLIDREVRELAEIEPVPQLRTLVRLLATRSGQMVAAGSLEHELGISRPTVLIFVDSGVATNLLDQDAHALRRPGAPFGPLLESFVGAELSRQLTWSTERAEPYPYREPGQGRG